MEEKKPLKIKFKTAVILIIVAVIIIGVCGANVYASKYGYDNIFFLIKYKISGRDERITDRDKLLLEDDDKNTVKNQIDRNDEKNNTNLTTSSNTISENSEKTESNYNTKNIVLYNGMEISTNVGVQDVSNMKITNDNKNKYNTNYYNYENGKYISETKGIFGNETFEGYSVVSNVKKIAMTKKYNAIPREFKTIKDLPKELIDMADYTSVDINEIDLDGDSKKEYIVCYTYNSSNDDYDGGDMKASSGIMLFDSNYKKISDLVSLENGFWGNIKSENNKVFISIKDVEYIDIDEDGTMEIIIKVPTYEGTKISILKYKDGVLNGEKSLKASVLP